MKFPLPSGLHASGPLLLAALLLVPTTRAQSSSATPATDSRPELAGKIDQLTKSLEQTQVELAESRTEIQQLRATLREVLARMNGASANAGPIVVPENPSASSAQTKPDAAPAAKISQDDWDILNARVDEQRQTKVESSSRYRLKLSGLALFNATAGFGQFDNVDLPSIAVPHFGGYSNGSVGATVRQSIIGLTGIGPTVFGARTSGDVQMDFWGGVPSGYGATSSGVAEVRIARIRLDWKNTSVVSGL